MNKDLFDSMQKQMDPGPEVRAALSEKLARPAKRRIPVRKYAAIAACAAMVIGGFSVYRLYQNPEKWMLLTKNIHYDAQVQHRHSYVLVDGFNTSFTTSGKDDIMELSGEEGIEDIYYPAIWDQNTDALSATETAPASGGNTHDDRPLISQDEAIRLYDILCSHLRSRYGHQENFSPNWPDWYGGGYLNNDRSDHVARLTLVLVKDYDTPALRQEIYDFLGSDHVDFLSGKYALSYLLDLQKKIMDYPIIREVFASSWTDEENNCLNLTLTEVTDEILIALAGLDPEDDAIYVQAGRRDTAYARDDLTVVMPDGTVSSAMWVGGVDNLPEDDENLIAYEPYYDGSDYNLERLPEELPQEKLSATAVQSVPEEEEGGPLTAVTYDMETGEITERTYPYSEGSGKNASRSTAPFDPGA